MRIRPAGNIPVTWMIVIDGADDMTCLTPDSQPMQTNTAQWMEDVLA